MKKHTALRPGTKAPVSGQYVEVGPKGGLKEEITAVKGKPLPPTNMPGSSFSLVDATKNESGKG
jgi:hypothetical protein